jgi:hypothetical protein
MKYIIPFLLLFSYSLPAQYVVESFQSEYEPLETYKSYFLEYNEVLYWQRFDLDFQFPFYDEYYDYIYMSTGVVIFDDSENFNMWLFDFIYDFDYPDDYYNIESDIHFGHTTYDGKQAFVVEFVKARLANDPSVAEFDSHINLQYRFYEDGRIAVHFGPRNLDNSPSYVPGEGFFLIVQDTAINLGPNLSIADLDGDPYFGVEGTVGNFTTPESLGRITEIPPVGWVVQFKPITVNTLESDLTQRYSVFPNPAVLFLHIEGDVNKEDDYEIFNTDGTLVSSGSLNGKKRIDVSMLSHGTYILNIGKNHVSKFVKE